MELAEENSPSSKFLELYKFTNAKFNLTHEERRNKFLESLRLRRNEVVNQNRNIEGELIKDVCDLQEVEQMQTGGPNGKKKKRKRKRKKKLDYYPYANKLMLSEWLTEMPSDLEENWLVKLCPFGQRRLVVAKSNTTIVYNKHGKMKDQFSSRLPGSIKSLTSCDSQATILDCIYNHQVHCYFVLDVLVWNGKCMQDYSTDFRFFFIKSKLNEMPELRTTDKDNHRRFIEIEEFYATRTLIEEKVTHRHVVNDKAIPLDGILFYHKESLYVCCINPFVGWIKPLMLTTLLNVTVPDCYLEDNTERILKTNRKNRNFKAEELLSNMISNMEIN